MEKLLQVLYHTRAGRALLALLIKPPVSKLSGVFLSSGFSKMLIPAFIRRNHIDMDDYPPQDYDSFNAFFTRNIKSELRPVDGNPEHLIAPCDSRLSVYPITADSRFMIKHTPYTLHELLRDKSLAERYEGGQLLVFRLSVDDYHHYCYVDDGIASCHRRIDGVFHTVNPIANDALPIYKENTRTYSLLKSRQFGTVLMMEVGAMLVGKITNLYEAREVTRGAEKGYFEYGGSTVILAFSENRVIIEEAILENTKNGIETRVKMGERIGSRTH